MAVGRGEGPWGEGPCPRDLWVSGGLGSELWPGRVGVACLYGEGGRRQLRAGLMGVPSALG